MNTPNYPPPAGPPRGGQQPPQGGPYGPPPGYGPPQTPPGGQPYGPGTPPGGQQYGQPYGAPGGRPPQTPPGGQQYGPGPGGPYGGPPPNTPPGGQPAGPPPPPGTDAGVPPAPMPKKSKKANLIRVGILVVILIAVAAFAFIFNKDAPASAKKGDCIHVIDVTDANIEIVDCKAADAMYKVGVTKEDPNAKCPNENYLAYSETGGSSDVRLCMVLLAKEGQCFKPDGQIKVVSDCTAKEAEFKVAKVIDGSDDPKGCGKGNEATAVTYPDPKLTLCLAAPDAAPAG